MVAPAGANSVTWRKTRRSRRYPDLPNRTPQKPARYPDLPSPGYAPDGPSGASWMS